MAQRPTRATGAGAGRERLLEAALRLFAARGYAGTSVRDILRAAGVTAPTLYHHFGNKEGLFLAILSAGQSRLRTVSQEALAAGGTSAARIRRLVRSYTALKRELADFSWALARIATGPAGSAPRFDHRGLATTAIRPFEQLVEEGMASGEFRPCEPRHVALAIAGAIDIASRPYLFDRRGNDADAALEGMLAAILSGITASSTRKASRRDASARRSVPL